MRVWRVRRATSKRLCRMASMALSNRTLSGCFDPTPASGFTDFLLVQAMVSTSSMPNTTINGIRRDIRPRNCWCGDSRLRLSGRAELGSFSVVPSIVRLAALIWSAPSSRALPGLTGSETRSHKNQNKKLNFLHGSFCCCLQQSLRILAWIAIPEHGVARHQNFCSGTNHVGDGLECHAAIHL